MIKALLLIIFFLIGSCPLNADQDTAADQDFINDLNSVKNPFDDGLPKPVYVAPKVTVYEPPPPPRFMPKPKSRPVPIVLPSMLLQGVVVGDGVYEAIIDDRVLPLEGRIKGAVVIAVTKAGAFLLYKGKKFFLKVD